VSTKAEQSATDEHSRITAEGKVFGAPKNSRAMMSTDPASSSVFAITNIVPIVNTAVLEKPLNAAPTHSKAVP
jgi:hypothetical protein